MGPKQKMGPQMRPQMGPKQKMGPQMDPKWAPNKNGTCPTWAWDMPNLAWDMPNLDQGHAHCPWSMDMPNQWALNFTAGRGPWILLYMFKRMYRPLAM